MFHDIYGEPARTAAKNFSDFLSTVPLPLTAEQQAVLAKLKATTNKASMLSPATSPRTSPKAKAKPHTTSQLEQPQLQPPTPNNQGNQSALVPLPGDNASSLEQSAGEICETSASSSPRVSVEPLPPPTPQQLSVLNGIEAAFLKAEDEHARAVVQQQLSARARLRKRLSEKQQQQQKRSKGGGSSSRNEATTSTSTHTISSSTSTAHSTDGALEVSTLSTGTPLGVSTQETSTSDLVTSSPGSASATDTLASRLSLQTTPPLPPGFSTTASISASTMSSAWPTSNVVGIAISIELSGKASCGNIHPGVNLELWFVLRTGLLPLPYFCCQIPPRRLPPVLQYCYERFLDYSDRQTLKGSHGTHRVIKFHWVGFGAVGNGWC